MAALEPSWATRFYGLSVGKDVAAAVREQLTDRTIEDLVDAHLAINQAYFGGIDKTLSGFVILDDEGDNYTLIDLRDGGQIWWQDHETREVELRFNSLADMKAKKAAPKPRAKRKPTTPALCARFQWLVWFLARPLMRNGKPMHTTDMLVRGGLGRFGSLFPDAAALDKAFDAELAKLADDPHLAIYWLLHTTALADDDRRRKVLLAVAASDHPLLRAFIARLGTLPLAGDLPIVPEFRARRALAQTYGAFEVPPDHMPVVCLRALEIAPDTSSLGHGLHVAAGLERGILADAAVQAALARIPETTPGTSLVAAALEKRAKAGSSSHADVLVRMLATSHDPWWTQLEALWHVHELAYDGPALVTATRRILAHDRYHRRALQMAMRAAQIAGEPIDSIYADLGIADAILPSFTKLVDEPDQWQAVINSFPLPHFKRALAVRVLQRVELNKPAAPLAVWAASELLGSSDPQRALIVSQALAKLDPKTQAQMVSASIDGPEHPLVAMIFAFLDGPEPEDNEFMAQSFLKDGKRAALTALAPHAHDPAIFDALMKLVERPAGGQLVDVIWETLFSPAEKTTCILPKLDDKQAVRVAKAMIKTKLRHPNIHARNSAGHQLYRFDHRGAESFLVDALTDYGVRYAAVRGPGGATLDRGKTENDQLEDLVANLYSAVRNLDTPAARSALVERLFAERRSYWRMANAIGDIWDEALHAQIMALLAERKDARAAGCYAFALRAFVKQGPPLVELAKLIIEWQGENEITRGFLHYALIVGMLAALDAGDLDTVRRAQDAASWISDPPLEPDDYSRGRTWPNPLDDEEMQARVTRALAGETEPAAKKPAAKKPAAKKPAAKKPAAKQAKAPAKQPPKAKPTVAAKAKGKAKATPPTKPKPKSKPKKKK
jgi:hypothetical protein